MCNVKILQRETNDQIFYVSEANNFCFPIIFSLLLLLRQIILDRTIVQSEN